MMSLEQAIKHAERAYKESRNGLQYALKRGETKFAERCEKDAEEYGQLAELLRELQERRKAPEIITCGECARRKTMCDGRDRCAVLNVFVDSDGYCKWAERRTE
jgi:hypothetical protein